MKATVKKSNNLIHVINVNDNKVNAKITIRLNDECKNGHQDFSLTGDFWETGKSRIDRNFTAAGCCHDEILKYFPDLKIFAELHLCDYTGVPLYAVSNGFYHLKNGFNNAKPNEQNFEKRFCEYYRINSKQFNILKEARTADQYALILVKLNIFDQWKEQANKAIEILEKLTDTKFLIDSKRTCLEEKYNTEKIDELLKLDKENYFQAEKVEERYNEEQQAKKEKLKSERIKRADSKIKEIKQDLHIDLLLIDLFNTDDNVIFYKHTNTIVFNWQDYGHKYTDEEMNIFINSIKKDKRFKDTLIKMK
jgi:hypothetical protein